MRVDPNRRHTVVTLGQALYEQRIRTRVEPAHVGKFVVLDVESGDYQVDADKLAALNRLRTHRPEAVPYIVRVGHPAAVMLGAAGLGKAG